MSFDLTNLEVPQKNLFDKALVYLKNSDLAKGIISGLDQSNAKIIIFMNRLKENLYTPGGDDGGGKINWNPGQSIETTNEKLHRKEAGSYVQPLTATPKHFKTWLGKEKGDMSAPLSPAVALIHEMGHAYQRLVSKEDFDKEWGERGSEKRTIMENINVNAIENTVVLELRAKNKLEGLRWQYKDCKLYSADEIYPGYSKDV